MTFVFLEKESTKLDNWGNNEILLGTQDGDYCWSGKKFSNNLRGYTLEETTSHDNIKGYLTDLEFNYLLFHQGVLNENDECKKWLTSLQEEGKKVYRYSFGKCALAEYPNQLVNNTPTFNNGKTIADFIRNPDKNLLHGLLRITDKKALEDQRKKVLCDLQLIIQAQKIILGTLSASQDTLLRTVNTLAEFADKHLANIGAADEEIKELKQTFKKYSEDKKIIPENIKDTLVKCEKLAKQLKEIAPDA